MNNKSKREVIETVQNCADFIPNTKMRRWFQAALETKSHSPSVISARCGVHRNTFYYWLTVPGFVHWWKQEMDLTLEMTKWRIIAIGLKAAENGSYKHWRSLMEYFGLLPHSKLTEIK